MGSSLSASTDSAIDKGDNDVAARVYELEKELISSKCELAQVMNRQSTLQEILKQKDEIILDLDDKLGRLTGQDVPYDSKRRVTQASKELQERIRILQNQNRFLNEEVRRLARLRSQEQTKIKDQDGRVSCLEADIEVWKLQYVSLIQSSIRFTGTDTMDDAELSLFGGDRHTDKVRSLLEEARKVNPSLPTFENLSAGEVHVDFYGFKHQFGDTGLLLHYLCQELTQHYLTQAASHEQHQQHWGIFIKANKNLMKNRQELKGLCRRGVPDQHRRLVWRSLIYHQLEDLMQEKGPHYFRSLCSMLPDSPLAARYRKQISLDLMRTMPSNVKFSTPGSKGIMDLQDVLLAFCVHNPNVGYCQGMNFLVAMALLFLDAQDAFWTLVAVTERYHTGSYFDHNLLGAQADQSVLRDLLGDLLPDLARHLAAIDIEISTVTLNWFLAIFFDAVPFPTLLRVWDCFLLEGPKVLFRFSLAVLKMHEKEIVRKTETISVMRHLKACARLTYDVDGLVKLAFQGMKPFPRRQDITSKQTYYLKSLKEKYRWRELQKLAFAERENLFLSLEAQTSDSLTFECCTVTDTGEVYVCYGHQNQCKVCVVDCKEGTMTDQPIQFSSRVMALCAVPDAILFGALSWSIHCYSLSDRLQVWEQRVHDAVLSLCRFSDGEATRVFAGLADGTVAVLEDVSVETTFYDVMYIMIGQSPVTCLRLLDSKLWCACGNSVSIFHANTLDALDSFQVSSNPYDHILSLEPGLPGVWVSVRGSSIIELWDPESLCCKMLYDTRAGRYPNLRKDDEVYFNRARITSMLPLDYSVWVGTGEGNLITYDVFTHQGSKTPSDSCSFVGSYTDSTSALVGKEVCAGLPGSEGFDPVREAAIRVRQLFLAQQDCDVDSGSLSRLTVSTASNTLVNNSTESVSRDPAKTDNNSTLTSDSQPDQQGSGPEEEKAVTGTLPEKATLSPGEDAEEITPSPSFCEALSSSGSRQKSQDNSSSEKETNYDQKEKGVESSVDDAKEQSDTVKARESRPKSVSPINGIHKFFIGEEEENLVNTVLSNGSLLQGRDCDLNKKNKAQSNGQAKANGQAVLSSESGNIAENNNDKPADKTGVNAETQETQSEGEKGGSVIMQVWEAFKKSRSNKSPKEPSPQVSDASQESDNSVKKAAESDSDKKKDDSVQEKESDVSKDASAENTPTNADSITREKSQPTTQSSTERGISATRINSTSNDSTASDPPQGGLSSKAKQGISKASSLDSAASDSQLEGSSSKVKQGISKASSLDSRTSESDEVFQDAMDNARKSQEEASCTSYTTVEESQYETGNDSSLSRESSQLSLRDSQGEKESESCASSDEGRKSSKKKRPQSLFGHHLSRQPKASGACVDKRDPRNPQSMPETRHRNTSNSSIAGTISSESTDNLRSADPEAQYRLDYTNCHVDTDMESMATDSRRNSCFAVDSIGMDSRRNSSIAMDSVGMDSRRNSSYAESDVRSDVSVWSQQLDDDSEAGDVGLQMLDCDPSSFIFPHDVLPDNDTVGRGMLDGGMAQLLHTPGLGSVSSCRTWSSYEEVSTPLSYAESNARMGRGRGCHLPRNSSLLSTGATSIASTTELLYAADMSLMSKNKISDKPVKCLLLYSQPEGKPLVLSFSGCHSDDEAVLKWSREKDEMLWTNDPILEYNPTTKTTVLPSYMKARLSSSSSNHSLKQRLSQGSQ